MSEKITLTLFEWLKSKRLIHSVAKEMGKPYTTLLYELRNRPRQPKLGADELVPLFGAIRAVGYREELDSLLKPWIGKIRGSEAESNSICEVQDLIDSLLRGTEAITITAVKMNPRTSGADLATFQARLRSEVLPAYAKLQSIIERKLENSGDENQGDFGDLAPAVI